MKLQTLKDARKGQRRWRLHLAWSLLAVAAAIVPFPEQEDAPPSGWEPTLEQTLERLMAEGLKDALEVAQEGIGQ